MGYFSLTCCCSSAADGKKKISEPTIAAMMPALSHGLSTLSIIGREQLQRRRKYRYRYQAGKEQKPHVRQRNPESKCHQYQSRPASSDGGRIARSPAMRRS